MLANTKIGELLARISGISEGEMWLKIANDEVVRDAIRETQIGQLKDGERPDGSLFDDYSETSVEVYGKPEGTIKWFDSGEFYNEGIEPIANETEIDMGVARTTDEFGEVLNLETKFNEEILGIQDGNFEKINETFKSEYTTELRRILFED